MKQEKMLKLSLLTVFVLVAIKQVFALMDLSVVFYVNSTIPWLSILSVVFFSVIIVLTLYALPIWLVIQVLEADFRAIQISVISKKQIAGCTYSYIYSSQKIYRLVNVSRC